MGKIVDFKKYKPRVIDKEIDECLKIFGAVCIIGPKYCGKSWTASYHSASEFLLQSFEKNFQNRTLAETSPETALLGDTPRLIDEWQDVPKIWDAVKYEVDSRGEKGQFILTGSSSPKNIKVMHDGTGRIERLRMRTMSLYETGDSDGSVSLEKLCEGELTPHIAKELSLDKIAEIVVRGGWPENTGEVSDIMKLPRHYAEAIIGWDTQATDGIAYSKDKLRLLLRSLARNESTTASLRKIRNDIANDPSYKTDKSLESEISLNTIIRYLDYLNRVYVTENIPPFAVNMVSSKRVKLAEKRHFCDPSIACAFLNETPSKLLGDLFTLGFLFEALCEHDLRIYAESFGGKLYHYEDYTNAEIDAVIEMPDGEWCAFEIELGENQVQTAADNLVKLKNEIEKAGEKGPSVMCVICGLTGYARRLENGVFVVPISSLRP